MIRTAVAAAALACAVAASPVIANEPMAKVHGRVPHGDLILSDPHHVAELRMRLEQVARGLCTQGIDRGWYDHPEVKACEARVVASGQARVAELTAGAGSPSRLAEHR